MVFEVLSCTEIGLSATERTVRLGGRCRAGAPMRISPPSLKAGGLRLPAREDVPLALTPQWSPFELTFAVPPDVPPEGWLLEVAPDTEPELEVARRALHSVDALHTRLDEIEARMARLANGSAHLANLLGR